MTSRHLLSVLQADGETLITQPEKSSIAVSTEHSAPVTSIYIPQDTMGNNRNDDTTVYSSSVLSETPTTFIQCNSSTQSLSDVTQSTQRSPTMSTDEEEEDMPSTPVPDHDSISYGGTIRTLQSSSITINKIHDQVTNSLFMDDFRDKHERDFRFVLQNPRGIKAFKDSDPEYYPTVQAMREGHTAENVSLKIL